MIGIRVDGNNRIATGHFMRCISIARGLRKVGIECIFITADEIGRPLLCSYGFNVVVLDSQWDKLDQELDIMNEVIQQNNIEKIIVDTYYVTYNYLENLERKTRVIYIDDLNLFKYPVSMILNYNIYSSLFEYEKNYKNSDVKLLLGCDFVPLRDEFTEIMPVFRKKVSKVLISTGGSDPYNVAGTLLSIIDKKDYFSEIEFHIIVGRMNCYEMQLEKIAAKRSSFHLHKNVKNMALLMMSCDVAVTAGGSTLYELCACGIPSITYSFADNQLCGVYEFKSLQIMEYAGDLRTDLEKGINLIIMFLKKYIEDLSYRKVQSEKMKKIVDGKGVVRIVKSIIDL